MPPKKKGNKKAQDDWEADLGESVAPQDAAPDPTAPADAPAEDDDAMGGGLMAALQRRKKKGKKGADQDFVEGEDPTANGGTATSKAPEEANFDDDDVFAGNYKPKKAKAEEKPAGKPADGEDGAPRVKTKAEKEKEKKEKEKQRKKELVCNHLYANMYFKALVNFMGRLQRRKRVVLQRPMPRNLPRPNLLLLPPPNLALPPPRPLRPVERRKN